MSSEDKEALELAEIALKWYVTELEAAALRDGTPSHLQLELGRRRRKFREARQVIQKLKNEV